jgi:proton-translocating NADH-quinone oxidoreductase chain N
MPPVLIVSLILSPVIYLSGRWRAMSAWVITLIGLATLWLVLLSLIRDFTSSGASIYTLWAVPFRFDGLSLLITAAALLISTVVTLFSIPDMNGKPCAEKYYAMLLLLTASVIGLVSSGDLFNLWVWFELSAISSYLLVAFYRENIDALAASIKYLIQTATGSILVLFGVALLFAQSGQLDFDHMALTASPLAVVAGTFFIIGFGVKMAFVPTHTWLPDAYAQAPSGISALLSGIVTVSGLVALMRVLGLLQGQGFEWGAVLIGFGTVNIVLGNLLALSQRELKRIFACSSISHIGFMVLAVGIGIYESQGLAFQGGMLHLLVHGLMKALAFLAAGAAIYIYGTGVSLRVNDLAGLAKREPLLAASMVIACLSLAGMPPLAGFMSKWQIFYAGVGTSSSTITLLTVFAAFNSVLSLGYYLPVINAMFRSEIRPPQRRLPLAMRVPVLVLSGALILIGLYPSLVDGIVVPAARALQALFGGAL